jgi:hypothetical protein
MNIVASILFAIYFGLCGALVVIFVIQWKGLK